MDFKIDFLKYKILNINFYNIKSLFMLKIENLIL